MIKSNQTTLSPAARICFVIILIAGFVLRFSNLEKFWINSDEGIYFFVASQKTLLATWQELVRQAHPPLFYFILRFLIWIFDSNLFQIKCFCILVGCLNIYFAGKLGQKISGIPGLIVSAGLFAFSPALITTSRLIRPYTFMLLFLTLALICFCNYLSFSRQESRERYKAVSQFGIYGAIALLFHYGAIFEIASIVLILVIERFRQNFSGIINSLLPIFLTVFFLISVHIQPIVHFNPFKNDYQTWLKPYFLHSISEVFTSSIALFAYLSGKLSAAVFGLSAIAGFFVAYKNYRNLVILFILVFSSTLLLSYLQIYPYGAARHSLHLMPLLVSGVCLFIANFAAKVNLVKNLPGIFIFIICVLAVYTKGSLKMLEYQTPHEEVLEKQEVYAAWNSIETILNSESTKDKSLFILDPQSFFSLVPFFVSAENKGLLKHTSRFSYSSEKADFVLGRGWYQNLGGNSAEKELEATLSESQKYKLQKDRLYLFVSDGFARSNWLNLGPEELKSLKMTKLYSSEHSSLFELL